MFVFLGIQTGKEGFFNRGKWGFFRKFRISQFANRNFSDIVWNREQKDAGFLDIEKQQKPRKNDVVKGKQKVHEKVFFYTENKAFVEGGEERIVEQEIEMAPN